MLATILTAIGIYLVAGAIWVLAMFLTRHISPGRCHPVVCWACLTLMWPLLLWELTFVDPMRSGDGPTLDA